MPPPDTTTPRMKVLAFHTIRTRGSVFTVIYDAHKLPAPGELLRRKSDGKCWKIRGCEKWAMPLTSWEGQPIGFLLEKGSKLDIGDEVEVVGSAV